MDLLQLRYFRTVARTEHITRAAKELRIAQPSLSMMIARLEEHLGLPLFDRNGRNIKLNEFGKIYLRYVEQSLTALEEGEHVLGELSGLEKGSISLVTYSILRFKNLLGGFFTKYPQANLRISQDGVMENRQQLLEQGKADFYLAYPPLFKTGIHSEHLWTDELVLAVPPSHRFAGRQRMMLSEAKAESFIGLKQGTSARILQDGFCRQAGFEPKVICEVDEPAAIAALVAAGLGVAFVPMSPNSADSSIWYIRIDEPKCLRPLHLAWIESRYLSKAAVAFRDYVVEYYARLGEAGMPIPPG